MNTFLKQVIHSAERLPDVDQEELAAQIDEMITQRQIALAEADIAAGRTAPLDEAFDRILSKLSTYGEGRTT